MCLGHRQVDWMRNIICSVRFPDAHDATANTGAVLCSDCHTSTGVL